MDPPKLFRGVNNTAKMNTIDGGAAFAATGDAFLPAHAWKSTIRLADAMDHNS